jgi:hypothetical protein
MARRLVERGVRFVQLYVNSQIWDNYTFLARDMRGARMENGMETAGRDHNSSAFSLWMA